jgi:hypothetical protein
VHGRPRAIIAGSLQAAARLSAAAVGGSPKAGHSEISEPKPYRARNRKFESISLQRGVTCELVLAATRAEDPDRRRLFASAGREMTERQDRLLKARLRLARLRHQAIIEDVDCRAPCELASGMPVMELQQPMTVWERRCRYWGDICRVRNRRWPSRTGYATSQRNRCRRAP